MDYTNILKNVIGGVFGNDHGMDQRKVQTGLNSILPMLLGQLNQNAQDPQERRNLDRALIDHENDDIEDSKRYIENFDRAESDRMVEKIFGTRRREVEEKAKKETGFSDEEVKKLLLMAAPLVIAHLAKKKKAQNLREEDLPEETENLRSHSGGILGNLKNMLDKDGDGNPLNDLLNL